MKIGREIVLRLLERYSDKIREEDFLAVYVSKDHKDLFTILIATILTQNTSDKNALKAFHNLMKKTNGRIDPENILNMDISELEMLVKPAGMYRRRAKTLINVARFFINEKKSIEKMILSRECEKLKEKLLEIEGVGEKTVDVVLLNMMRCPYFPVDTHIMRITRRLGLVDEKAGYKEISSFWRSVVDEVYYLKLHLILIHHGRTICRAKKPLCEKCVIKDLCRYREKTS
ncbi:MAG: endonuclease III [Desulfurococcaceae archaeon]|nr:endonuclease III [Desulfurococcaceae archaeon]